MESVQRVMDEGGFNAWVIMGDKMRYVRVIPFVTVLIGDGKNGDTLVLRFGGKNCLGHVSRLCMMPFGWFSVGPNTYVSSDQSVDAEEFVRQVRRPKPDAPTAEGIQECA
jgi:hypothetical protein